MATRNTLSLSVLFSKTPYFAKTYLHSCTVSCNIPREARIPNLSIINNNFFALTARKVSKYVSEKSNDKVNDLCASLKVLDTGEVDCAALKAKKSQENQEKKKDASKNNLIKSLNFQSDDDALPFYKLPIKTLLNIYKTTKKDEEYGYCKNRLYYIADHIKCPPYILSQRIVRRTFVYNLSFDWLESSLNVLLDMGVTGDRILRDLWVLKYHHKTIQERLQRVRNDGVDNLYPWMVRCSEDILNRSIQIFQETKSILGDNKSTKMYLASRLNISPEIIEDMYIKVPALKTTRAVKVKRFLDFLLEQGFSLEEITNKARILTASQNTVKQRLEKLRALGLQEINLNVLCRSRKDFQKYCESIESITKEQ